MSVSMPRIPVLARVRKTVGSLPVRIAVSAGLVGLVASQINWRELGNRLGHGHPWDFVGAVALVIVALCVGTYRWSCLLRKADVPLGVGPLARIYAVATFSNTFLPTSVGGDVTRALLVARRAPLLTRVAITIVVDRLGGLAGLLGMAWMAFAFQPGVVPHGARVFLGWVTGAVVVGSIATVVLLLRGSPRIRAALPSKVAPAVGESRSLLLEYARDPATIGVVLVTSFAYQGLISLQLVMLARAIDVHLSFATAAVVLALVTIVTLVPISIGGFGIREGSYVVLLGGASISATDATLISVLSVAGLFFASLPGALLLARGGLAPAAEARSR